MNLPFEFTQRMKRLWLWAFIFMMIHVSAVVFGFATSSSLTFKDLIFLSALMTWLQEGGAK